MYKGHIYLFICIFVSLLISVSCSTHRFNNEIKVIAHRGDHINYPENSLAGVLSCINMGVDMVEIDLSRTKDNVLVLMHAETLDRTTNGLGLVRNWSYDSLTSLKLKNKDGTLSNEKIPTFKQVMSLSAGKIEMFIDKGYDYIPDALKIL